MTTTLWIVACLDEDEVAAFLSGRLAPDAIATLDAHVATCRACREWLSALAGDAAADHNAATPAAAEVESEADGSRAVYGSRSPELDREIADKLRHRRAASHGERALTLDLVHRDAHAAARLAQPGTVTVHDVGVLPGHVFLATELFEGQTLADWLTAAPRDRKAVLAMFLAAGDALAALHARGTPGSGFSPARVVVGDDGRVRIGGHGDARDDQLAFCAELGAAIPAPRPRWLERVIRRGTAPALDRRYPSFAALLAALRRGSRRWTLSLAIAGAAAALAIAALAVAAAR